MKIIEYPRARRIILEPGDHYAAAQPEILSTLLGSCVACCLYDPVKHIFGMNHFLLATQYPVLDGPVLTSDAGRYGIHAMELLINDLMKLGANRLRLRAKCFGGSDILRISVRTSLPTVGQTNVDFIESFLNSENIPIVSACLGGRQGLNIHFLGHDFSVRVKKIGAAKLSDVEHQEAHFWQKQIKAPEVGHLDTW
ncbi:MAG: chemotaxis protein CheD [Methylococcales bacterium]|nr:chemotaxis protein CheD [Methylococcales bacterium]